MKRSNVIPIAAVLASESGTPLRAELIAITEEGNLTVRDDAGREFDCDWLVTGADLVLQPGDRLAVLPPDSTGKGLALGRVGAYQKPEPQARITLEATESVTLRCGDTVLDLRADGKAILKGDDVLIRAKGLQRIKAGSVSIN
ncbi:hypothetical protein OPU71_10765 [Niveibacterium sp. 24ML]|uniref:hypothetical protein n=1 Tax=Niveibacterium sp. 24ML TaxID=2985512 RepID=UPI00226DFC79|nr:hypothetical protein [Niveibacterium sp. 24ML]MCX9156603.1 hypothetical protein [Niveibacterium sp. 24ML]